MIPIKVPSVGESISSGILGSWKKRPGTYVRAGDALFEFETDKVTSEVFAEAPGLLRQLVSEGTEVKIGQIVGEIDESAPAPASDIPPSAPNPQSSSSPATPHSSPPPVPTSQPSSLSPQPSPTPGRLDKDAYLRAAAEDYQITPSNKTGPAGRETRTRMSSLRRKIAGRLVAAQQTAAHLTTFNECDMSAVMDLRSRFQERFTAAHGVKLGFMSLFLKAAVHALRSVPNVNARLEGDEIVHQHYFDIGIAVSTEKGLMVPVLRGIDELPLAGIEKGILELSQKARSGKIQLTDFEGGVFTITNGGIFGSLLSTPILNPPQSAILGMHTIQERPIAVQGRVEIRPMMYLALSYDHRLVDGREAVTFLVRIKEFIENPALALLDL